MQMSIMSGPNNTVCFVHGSRPPLLTVCVNYVNLGDVLHLSVLGKSIVVLNTEEAAFELLDKRSAIYSDRPRFPMQDLYAFVTPASVEFNIDLALSASVGQTSWSSYLMENNF